MNTYRCVCGQSHNKANCPKCGRRNPNYGSGDYASHSMSDNIDPSWSSSSSWTSSSDSCSSSYSSDCGSSSCGCD